jgi:DNA-directed RNA polymerase subunit RPC12/RpoP
MRTACPPNLVTAIAAEYKNRVIETKGRRIHRCPRCQSGHIQRVARRGFYERLILPLMLRRAYRCRECSERFYDRKS